MFHLKQIKEQLTKRIKMNIILLEKINNLGALGEKVKVKSGYGRNFLIPQGKAIPATAANVEKYINIIIEKSMLRSVKNLVFVVGGAYGFSDAVYKKANQKIALSQMTFSHQIIRMIFLEQIYRAFTIINKEPYHHE